MKSWQETSRVAAVLSDELAAGRSCVLAVLLHVKGSGYRRPGAKLLVQANGFLHGNVSGGCLEADLRERAARILATGIAERIHYDTSDDERVAWGLGLGCNGQIDIWAFPVTPADSRFIADLRNRLAGDRAFSIVFPLAPEAAGPTLAEASPGDACRIETGGGDRFIDVLEPPPSFVILGAGDDSVPLAALAARAGFRVTVVDHREAMLDPALYPDATRVRRRPEDGIQGLPAGASTLVVIKAHHIRLDRAWASLYAATNARYIGLLGPRARREDILASIPVAHRDRFHGPCGLDIGAEGAEQVSISIVAEALAVWAGRAGGALKERTGPIHSST